MATYCKNSKLGCLSSTMDKSEEFFTNPYECDKCWEVRRVVKELHDSIFEMNDEEPMDGDATETLSKVFLQELNRLNGNK